jgi:hypothetical protein
MLQYLLMPFIGIFTAYVGTTVQTSAEYLSSLLPTIKKAKEFRRMHHED